MSRTTFRAERLHRLRRRAAHLGRQCQPEVVDDDAAVADPDVDASESRVDPDSVSAEDVGGR
jgi:hypothetical protein